MLPTNSKVTSPNRRIRLQCYPFYDVNKATQSSKIKSDAEKH